MMTTTPDWAEEAARVHALRLAACEWRADPVGGRTRLIKDIAREHSAPDWMMTRVYFRIRPVSVPVARNFQDLDAYAAAWRSVLVGGPRPLREYKAAAVYCAKSIRARRRAEERFLAKHPRPTATINKAHAHRAWRRNAERMALHWPEAH
jgi:hypothetical protein